VTKVKDKQTELHRISNHSPTFWHIHYWFLASFEANMG